MDPELLLRADWGQTRQVVFTTAAFSVSFIIFLGSVLLAQVLLPSLAGTGHLGAGVLRLRPFLWMVAVLALGVAVLSIVRAATLTMGVMDFYPRFGQ